MWLLRDTWFILLAALFGRRICFVQAEGIKHSGVLSSNKVSKTDGFDAAHVPLTKEVNASIVRRMHTQVMHSGEQTFNNIIVQDNIVDKPPKLGGKAKNAVRSHRQIMRSERKVLSSLSTQGRVVIDDIGSDLLPTRMNLSKLNYAASIFRGQYGGYHVERTSHNPETRVQISQTSLVRRNKGAANPCKCRSSWSDSSTGGQCGETQTGCPAIACDGDSTSWCLIANPGCDEEETYYGSGWAYCQATCVCKTAWTATHDNRCLTTQSGCEAQACDGDSPWCIVENPGCTGERDGWAYCTPQEAQANKQCPSGCAPGCWDNDNNPNRCMKGGQQGACELKNGVWCSQASTPMPPTLEPSTLMPPTLVPPTPPGTSTCATGDAVQANWNERGIYYGAVITSINVDGTITVDWNDGDTSGRTLEAAQVRKDDLPCQAPPTPAIPVVPTTPPTPTEVKSIASIRIGATAEDFARSQKTSEYNELQAAESKTFFAARRCNEFQIIFSTTPRSRGESLFAHANRLEKPTPPPASATAAHSADEATPSDELLAWFRENITQWDTLTCNSDARALDACTARKQNVESAREALDTECDFPVGAPSAAILAHTFCADDQATCRTFYDGIKECISRRAPLDAEIDDCDNCVNGASSSSMAELRRSLNSEELDETAKTQAHKDAVYKEQEMMKRRAHMEMLKAAEYDLFRGRATSPTSKIVHNKNSTFSWPPPQQVDLIFHASNYNSDPEEAGVWSATVVGTCDHAANECTYKVTIPCTAVVGPGHLMLSGGVEMNTWLLILFNPYDSNDETHMDGFSSDEMRTYLVQNTAGVWRGSSRQNNPMNWKLDQFDPDVLRAVMTLTTMIPIVQRGQAPRVARWLTYLINKEVLWGNWCSDDGCMDDASKKPWEWTGSKEIYQEWLQKDKPVKYGQCWVFASLLVTACRSLGLGSRVVTNFDSAHGKPPYNKGIDDYFTYDDNGKPSVAHANKMESIWNFHVWNDVWMKRSDLPGLDADGWQAIDSTPQEQSCEVQDGTQNCRSMMGPAPLKVIYNRKMESKGSETPYQAVGAGVSYDSMFVYGETQGDWRGYIPAKKDWTSCTPKCKADWRGDGYCDPECNNEGCDFDVGDCCEEKCTEPVDGVPLYKKYTCGESPYDCKSTNSLGWALYYKDTRHVGKLITTQKAGDWWWARNDVALVDYKAEQ